MAVPSYTTDLLPISTCEATTNWAESGTTGWNAGSSITQESDYYIQGNYCVSEVLKTGIGSLIFNYGSGISIPAGTVFMCWHYCIGPTALANYSDGGIRMIMGSSLTAFWSWDVWGKDYYTYGGWICIPLDRQVPPDDTVSTPSSASGFQYFGNALNVTGTISKGNSHGIDVLRYGRGAAIFSGGQADNPCTFAGFAAQNDSSSNRWGLIQSVPGGYLWQGLMTIGASGASATFIDSNVLVFVNQQLKVYETFNKIEIGHGSTVLDWTNIVFKSTGGVSKGMLETVNDADVSLNSCSFIDLDTLIFKSRSTLESCNFVRCGKVTQGGASMTGCSFDLSTAAVTLDVGNNVNLVTDSVFISDGTGYAMEGFSVAGSYNLVDINFTNYAAGDGSTGNEAIHVLATTGTVILNIYGGNSPSVHSAGAIISKVQDPVTLTLTVTTADGTPVEGAMVAIAASDGAGPFPYLESVTIVNSGTTATVSHTGHGMASGDYVRIHGASHYQNNGIFEITYVNANSYTYTMPSAPGSNPTGSIVSTFVALYGLTDENGQKIDSRVYSSDQNVMGWARKGSSAPYYKSGPVTGTIDKDTGWSGSAVLVLDQ